MIKRKTQEEFEQELKLILPDVEVIGKYINTNTKIHCRCKIHNYEFDATPNNMLKGHGCRLCGNEKQSKAQTKTHEQFVMDVNEINPDINVLGKYVNYSSKVLVECKKDGYQWEADPRGILRGRKCPVCMNKVVVPGINDVATTRPDLIQYFKNKKETTLYVAGSEVDIDVICPKCGTEKRTRLANLSRFGLACNTCYEKKYGHKRATYKYWNKGTMQSYLNENMPGYVVLDTKVDEKNNLFVHISCPNANHQPYWANWNNIQAGYKCKQCFYESRGKTQWTPDLAYDFYRSNGFTVLDKNDFVNTGKSVPCFNEEGYIYMINIDNLRKYQNGERSVFSRFQHNPYAIHNIKQFCKLKRPEYDILSTEYHGTTEQYDFIYFGEFDDNKEHNRVFTTTVSNFVFGGVGHPDLTMSKGERMAKKIFIQHNIAFSPQYTWKDCKYKYALPFDFYLPDYNLVVEIMGEQHEHPVERFGGETTFNDTVRNDKIKRDYLKSHNILILDIWYYEFDNMENLILDKIKSIIDYNSYKEETA